MAAAILAFYSGKLHGSDLTNRSRRPAADAAPVLNTLDVIRKVTGKDNNWYGSEYFGADWHALQGLVMGHLQFRDGEAVPPDEIEMPEIPSHLEATDVVRLVLRYRQTHDESLLREAGALLAPDAGEDWWQVVSKG